MRPISAAALALLSFASLLPLAQAAEQPAIDWSGAYLGASLGGAEGKGDTSTEVSFNGPNDWFTTNDPGQLGGMGDGGLSQWDASAGLFAGYGVQEGNLYWGVEASLNSLGFDEKRTPPAQTVIDAPTNTFGVEQSVEADWQGTLRLRAGWAQERWLAYVTGGLAVTRVKLSARFYDDYAPPSVGQGSSEETMTGWVLGLGGEYALSERCSLRAEYLYADYGTMDTQFTVTNPLPAFSTLSSSMKHDVDFKTQTAALGLAYHF